jgi:hypothetical protein
MAPRAMPDMRLTFELGEIVREIYKANREELTVNLVRSLTEKRLGLEEGFFKDEAWKARSKQIIKETVVRTAFYPC